MSAVLSSVYDTVSHEWTIIIIILEIWSYVILTDIINFSQLRH